MNKNSQTALYVVAGALGAIIIGIVIIFCGLALSQTEAHIYYVVGACFMLVTAIYFRFTYFIALELILIAGHGAVLLGLGSISQIVLPILLCLQLLLYYLLSGQLNNIFRLSGIAGIALISIGFSFENQWVFLFGSMGISIFSFYQVYRGRLVALLWAILNTIFVFVSFFKIIL